MNSPKYVDDLGIKNAVKAIEDINADASKGIGRPIRQVTLLSSIGVQRRNQFPFVILNLFGVLDSKSAGEIALKEASKRAGFKYAIVRPGRLVGGPYTNPDFAKLLQLDEGELRNVDLRVGDPDGFAGEYQLLSTALIILWSSHVFLKAGRVLFVAVILIMCLSVPVKLSDGRRCAGRRRVATADGHSAGPDPHPGRHPSDVILSKELSKANL